MNSFDELQEIWDSVAAPFSELLSTSSFDLWFGSVRLVFLNEDTALLTVDRDLKRNILNDKYLDPIRDNFYNVLGFEVDVAIFAGEKINTYEDARALYDRYVKQKVADAEQQNQKEMESAIKIISPQKKAISYYTFDNFIVGESNKFAYAACYSIAHNEEDGSCPYNPLVIHGKSGLGKTHLMYAVINRLLERDPNQKVVYIKGEEFTVKLVEAIKNNSTDQFREKYRGADILLMDDIQFIAGKSSTQEEFFHTFNALYESQKQIIVTCDRPIEDIKNMEERIRTRLEWGLSADITAPDTELRMAIIRKKAEEVNLPLDESIVEFMAHRLKNNVRLIEGGVKKMSALRFIMGKEITYDLAVREISGLVPDDEPQSAKVDKILQSVCDTYNISQDTIKGKSRRANVVLARQVSWYALRLTLDMTYEAVGAIFGYDHTTVMSGLKKIDTRRAQDPVFADEMDTLLRDIKENLIK